MSNESDGLKGYPIDNVLAGWVFRVVEVSNGAFRGEGKDLHGREVACSGNSLSEVIEKCKSYAIAISK